MSDQSIPRDEGMELAIAIRNEIAPKRGRTVEVSDNWLRTVKGAWIKLYSSMDEAKKGLEYLQKSGISHTTINRFGRPIVFRSTDALKNISSTMMDETFKNIIATTQEMNESAQFVLVIMVPPDNFAWCEVNPLYTFITK
jgi:hypothetical protein